METIASIIVLVLTGSTLIITAFYIWWTSRIPGAKMVSLLILVGTTWVLAYIAELESFQLSAKIFWDRIQFSAMVVIPSLWVTNVLQFGGLEKWLNRRAIALLGGVPALAMLLVFTNDAHHVLWSSIEEVPWGSVIVLEKTYSPGYWALVVYSFVLILFGFFLLLQVFFRSRHLYRHWGRMLLLVVFLPLAGWLVFVLGAVPLVRLDWPPVLVAVTVIVTAWGVARMELANIIPVAWEAVIDSIGDSVIVLDRNNSIVNLNPSAQRLFDRPVSAVVGQPIEMVWPGPPSCVEDLWHEGGTSREVTIDLENVHVTYDMRVSPLADWRGQTVNQIMVLRDITERKHAETLLHESEEKFRTIFENSSDEIVLMDRYGTIIDINRKPGGLFGYEPTEILGKHFTELTFSGLDMNRLANVFTDSILRTGHMPTALMELELRHKNGSRVFAEVSTALIRKNDEVEGILAIVRDITERKEAEEKIRASLKEKEVLLREVHHRVKNNLQVISSLLNLQSASVKDSQFKAMLKESQDRIRSMALIHEKLYQSEALAHIDSDEYITSLVRGLYRSYGAPPGVTFTVEAGAAPLDVDTAISCGLIINELVSNALKYAFPHGRGEIAVVLHAVDDMTELVVSDNGVGIPEGVDFRHTETLGLRLVTLLAEEQLGGEITLTRDGGTTFHIRFGRKG